MAFWKELLANRGKISAATPVRPPGAVSAQISAHQTMHSQQSANLIQVPDISRKLVTRYGLREKAPSPTLAAEVVPVVLVDDLVGESDLIRPRIKPCAGQLAVTAAAQWVVLGVWNPPNSGVILHLYYFVAMGTGSALFNLTFTGSPFAGVTVGVSGYRNGLFPNQSPVGSMRGGLSAIDPAAAMGGAIEMKYRNGVTTGGIFPFDAVLDEGQALQAVSSVAITGSHEMSMVWSEEAKR